MASSGDDLYGDIYGGMAISSASGGDNLLGGVTMNEQRDVPGQPGNGAGAGASAPVPAHMPHPSGMPVSGPMGGPPRGPMMGGPPRGPMMGGPMMGGPMMGHGPMGGPMGGPPRGPMMGGPPRGPMMGGPMMGGPMMGGPMMGGPMMGGPMAGPPHATAGPGPPAAAAATGGGPGAGSQPADTSFACLSNVSWWTTEAAIKAQLEEFGQVVFVHVFSTPHNGKGAGFAFVELKGADSAANAARALSGRELFGSVWTVSVGHAGDKNDAHRSKMTGLCPPGMPVPTVDEIDDPSYDPRPSKRTRPNPDHVEFPSVRSGHRDQTADRRGHSRERDRSERGRDSRSDRRKDRSRSRRSSHERSGSSRHRSSSRRRHDDSGSSRKRDRSRDRYSSSRHRSRR